MFKNFKKINKRKYRSLLRRPKQLGLFIWRVLRRIFRPPTFRERVIYISFAIFALLLGTNAITTANLEPNVGKYRLVPARICEAPYDWSLPRAAEGVPAEPSTIDTVATASGQEPLICRGFELTDSAHSQLRVQIVTAPALTGIDANPFNLLPGSTSAILLDEKPVKTETTETEQTYIVETSLNGEVWDRAGVVSPALISQETFYLDVATAVQDIGNLMIRIKPSSLGQELIPLAVESVGLVYRIEATPELSITAADQDGSPLSAGRLTTRSNQLSLSLTTKKHGDGFFEGVSGNIKHMASDKTPDFDVESHLRHSSGQRFQINDDQVEVEWKGQSLDGSDKWHVSFDAPEGLAPGQYSAQIIFTDADGNVTSVEEDIVWGVLALNTDRDIYTPGQTANFSIGVLNKLGEPVCDSTVELNIRQGGSLVEKLSTEDDSLQRSSTCEVYGGHIEPDYSGSIILEKAGGYTLELVADIEGESYVVENLVTADEAPQVSVRRLAPTRTYPPLTYPMIIELTTRSQFIGVVEEELPLGFEVSSLDFVQPYREVIERDGKQVVVWDVATISGETVNLGYSFKGPQISPALFFMGELSLRPNDGKVVSEKRQWQIASDALGDLAIYSEATGGVTIGTTATDISWDTTNFQSGNFTLETNGVEARVNEAGHYLVMYSVPTQSSGGSGVSEVQSWLRINDHTSSNYGWGYGSVLRADGADEAYNSGSAILQLSQNDKVRVQLQRTDNNSATIQQRSNLSGLQLLKLDDTWSYLRSESTTTQTFGSDTSFSSVNLNRDDEVDSADFGRSNGAITLKTAGHYLVTYNVGANHTDTNHLNLETRLTLDGSEVAASKVTGFSPGQNNAQDTAAGWSGIISTSSANQILRLQMRRESEFNVSGLVTDPAKTGITVTKLPDSADFLRLSEAGGGQDLSTSTSALDLDTSLEIDTNSFSYSGSNPTRATIEQDGTYLFLGSAYTSRAAGDSTRESAKLQWRVNGSTSLAYGASGQINPGDDGINAANTSGSAATALLPHLSANDYVELTQQNEATNSTATYQANQVGIQALNADSLSSATPDVRQVHYRWRDNSVDVNSSGGYLAAEDTSAIERNKYSPTRLRLGVANVGDRDDTYSRSFKLQFVVLPSGQNCSTQTSWTGVNDSASDGVQMVETSWIEPDGESLNGALLANAESYMVDVGEARDTADTTTTMTPLLQSHVRELEYSLQFTDDSVTDTTYCFRLYDQANNRTLDGYDEIPELSVANTTISSGQSVDQDVFRWYDNTNGVQPTNARATENSGASSTGTGDVLRLRMGVQVGTSNLSSSSLALTLQYAQANNCSLASSWTDVGGIGSGSIWRGFNNAAPADGAAISASLLKGGSGVVQSYEEQNDSANNLQAINNGSRGEWDWVIENNGSRAASYCFRVVTGSDETVQYTRYPQVTVSRSTNGLYVESASAWTPTTANSWTDINLSGSPYNVPANSVVEVLVSSGDCGAGNTVGVRANGSSINRRIQLAEAEGATAGPNCTQDQGENHMALHVQTDSNSIIEYYTTSTSETSFRLLGYWVSGTFVEGWTSFKAGASNSWQDVNLSGAPYNTPVNRVVEIVGLNGEDASENQIGVRRNNSALSRTIVVGEAEDPTTSYIASTFFAQGDQSSIVEVFAEDDINVDFYFSGYWDVPPGYYTELNATITNPTVSNTWQNRDLTANGVPDNATTEFIIGNQEHNSFHNMGVRGGSSTLNRVASFMESEKKVGTTPARMHAVSDSTASVQILHSDISSTNHIFRLVGYWTPNVAPSVPSSLAQRQTDDTNILVGEWVNASTVRFAGQMSDNHNFEAVQLCLEVQLIGVSFTNVDTACSSTSAYNGTAVTSNLDQALTAGDSQYHWQVRVRDMFGAYSNWVKFGNNNESARDFGLDTTGPTDGTVYDGLVPFADVDYNGGDLDRLEANWTGFHTGGVGLDHYEYSIGTSPGGTGVLGWTNAGLTTSVTITGLSLQTSQIYYVNVRAHDEFNRTAVATSDGVYVAPTLSFTLGGGDILFEDLGASNSYTDTFDSTLTTSTNAHNGYSISMYALGPLTSDQGHVIPDFPDGDWSTPAEWTGASYGFGYTSSDTSVQGVNRFQSVSCLGGGNAPCYASYSQVSPGDIIADNTSTVVGAPIINEVFTITHRVGVDINQTAKTYTTELIYLVRPRY